MANGNNSPIPKFEFELESVNNISRCFDRVSWHLNLNLNFREPAHCGLPLQLCVESKAMPTRVLISTFEFNFNELAHYVWIYYQDVDWRYKLWSATISNVKLNLWLCVGGKALRLRILVPKFDLAPTLSATYLSCCALDVSRYDHNQIPIWTWAYELDLWLFVGGQALQSRFEHKLEWACALPVDWLSSYAWM